MEMKYALSNLSKAPVVVQGDRKGNELGREARTYAEAAKGGRAEYRVVVHGGSDSLLESQNGEKDKKVGE